MSAQIQDTKAQQKASEKKRAYPGATLRHLGSVRDVTLAKTHGAIEPFGTRPRLP